MLTYPTTFFWDDWIVYDFKDRQSFITSELMSGFAPWRAHFESLLLEFGPGAFRFVSFVSLFVSAVALNRTMKYLNHLRESEIKIITCLFLFLPLFSPGKLHIDHQIFIRVDDHLDHSFHSQFWDLFTSCIFCTSSTD
jgi:hypothetical protein